MKEAFQTGNYHLACQLAKQSLSLPDNEDSIHVLARSYQALAQYDDAIPYALQEVANSKEDIQLAHNYVNLAEIYFEAGQHQKGYTALQKGYRILQAKKLENTLYFLPFWLATSRMYRTGRKWKEAIRGVDNALRILRSSTPRGYRKKGVYFTLLTDRAHILMQLRRYSDALADQWEAHYGFLTLLGDQHASYATCCISLANIYYACQHVRAALPLYQEGLTIYLRVWGPSDCKSVEISSIISVCRRRIDAMEIAEEKKKNSKPLQEWFMNDRLQCSGCQKYFAILIQPDNKCDFCHLKF